MKSHIMLLFAVMGALLSTAFAYADEPDAFEQVFGGDNSFQDDAVRDKQVSNLPEGFVHAVWRPNDPQFMRLGDMADAELIRVQRYRGYRAPRTYNYNRSYSSRSRSYGNSRSYTRSAPRVRPPAVRAPIVRAPRTRAAPSRATTMRPITRARPVTNNRALSRKAIAPNKSLTRMRSVTQRVARSPQRLSQQMRKLTPKSLRAPRSAALQRGKTFRTPRVMSNRFVRANRGAIRSSTSRALTSRASLTRRGAAITNKASGGRRGVGNGGRGGGNRSGASGGGNKKSPAMQVMAMGKRTPLILAGNGRNVRAMTGSNQKRAAMISKSGQRGVVQLNKRQKQARKAVANDNVKKSSARLRNPANDNSSKRLARRNVKHPSAHAINAELKKSYQSLMKSTTSGSFNLASRSKLHKAPFDSKMPVRRFNLGRNSEFVRLTTNPKSPTGSWVMRRKDLLGANGKMLSPAQLQKKFALPQKPTHVATVQLPKGTKLIEGTASKVEGWGPGGGRQFYIQGMPRGASSKNVSRIDSLN